MKPTPAVPATSTETPQQHEFGQAARRHLEALAAIGARVSGSPNERLTQQYIAKTFTQLGYSPQVQSFSARDEDGNEFTSANVVAVKLGNSPTEIIIGAHYDSGNEGLGVDDNASGIAILLETAEQIANAQTPYTIRFIAFGSEENDLDGSYYYAKLMSLADRQNTLAMVNLDSLAAGDIAYVYSDEGRNAFLRDWALAWAGENGLPLQTIPHVNLMDGSDYVADYSAFKEAGIPYIYFEATNWTLGDQDGYTQVAPQYGDEGYIWHTQYDTLEYLDTTFPGRVNEHLTLFCATLYAIATEFTQP